jgi:hypothetical protein
MNNAQRTLHQQRQVDEIRLQELIAQWLVDRRYPLVEVQSIKFRKLIEYINPLVVSKIPKSANTTRSDIMQCFKTAKQSITEKFSTARSKIHLSFDLWSSPNHKSIMAIVGHWTNSEFKVETATLGMKEIFGEHKGEHLAPVIYKLLQEYGIEDKVGWFQSDNASNNNTMLRHLNRAIQENGGEGFDVEERRLRCLAHTMNLAVKLLFFNGNVATMSKELQEIVVDVHGGLTEARKKA